jgi:hypothetical protein
MTRSPSSKYKETVLPSSVRQKRELSAIDGSFLFMGDSAYTTLLEKGPETVLQILLMGANRRPVVVLIMIREMRSQNES